MVILSIVAIILAILAIMPYGLELWFWHYRKPRIMVEVNKKGASFDNTTQLTDIELWLGIRLNSRYPAYFRNLNLVLPLEAEPYPHPSSGDRFEIKVYLEDGPGLRIALVLGPPMYHPESTTLTHIYMIAFKLKGGTKNVKLDLISEVEIDEARLGVWSIFHPSRRYLNMLTINLNVSQQSTGVESFEG